MTSLRDGFRETAGRVPPRWRRKIPTRARNLLVRHFGHPTGTFDPSQAPRRLNLGAGWDIREGYLNVDAQAFHSPDLVADVRALRQLPSGHYEEIVAQDVLEHLDRADVPVALAEWRRLLAEGGLLSLRVPDLPALLRWLEASDDANRQREVMHLLFGTQAYRGDFHHAGFTDVLLADELLRAGFARIELERRDEWLWEGVAYAASDHDQKTALALAWTHGFYQREREENGSTWRWAGPDAELAVYAARSGTVIIDIELLHGEALVSALGTGELVTPRLIDPGRHRIELDVSQGANRVRFTAARLTGDAINDSRELAFQLSGRVSAVAI